MPAPGVIRVAVSTSAEGARLVVSDNGPGIAAEDRSRAVLPFVRLGTARDDGSGLGLSLVAAIARLHGARLSLESNDPGLRVVVDFPPPPSSAG